MIPLREGMSDIGGLDNLKQWLERKAKILTNMDEAQKFGVDMPKGVLIAGVPGCGKSLSAKAAAKRFNIPLLRMDMGRLLGKYGGRIRGKYAQVLLNWRKRFLPVSSGLTSWRRLLRVLAARAPALK